MLLSLFILATILLMILEIKRICNYFGVNSDNISSLLSFYRSKGVLYSNEH